MQNLDIISVNIWQIVISLCNLAILFLLLKKFLFKPVKDIMAKRTEEVEAEYKAARKAHEEADSIKADWEEKITGAQAEADNIIKDAVDKADRRTEVILYESREKAEAIIRKAKADAERDRRDAQEGIKKEIVDVSAAISEKIIGREINMEDHHDIIDSFIDKIGEN